MNSSEVNQSGARWWREKQLLLVLVLAVVAYCLRVDALQLFGEEPRRALIAREMIESGDWLVPGTQRVFLPSRPPLQNWLIAIAGLVLGSIDTLAARLPSIVSTIGLAVLIYGYLRQTIAPLGSAAGSVAWLTMQIVLEFGRSAETEAVFTAFVAPSMLLWHWGWIARWPVWKMWTVGYGLAALGMLTKGLQAPVYFAGSACLFLLWTGNWKAIFAPGHFFGFFVFWIIFGAWQVPFAMHRGIQDSLNIYFADVADRFVDKSWAKFFVHLISYPVELLAVRLLPWSILLLSFGDRSIRARLGHRRQTVDFLTICILFSFVFVWLPTGSKLRYYMPLFPHFAALVGIAVDCLAQEIAETGQSRLWTNFVRLAAITMVATGALILGISFANPGSLMSMPLPSALLFAASTSILGGIAIVSLRKPNQTAWMLREIFCIGLFCALVQLTLVTQVLQRRCEDIAGNVEKLRNELPSDIHLVSFGPVHHAFAYYFRRPIPIVPVPLDKPPADVDYFCVHVFDPQSPKLPFNWIPIADVRVDRFNDAKVPRERVVVGRVQSTNERESDKAESKTNVEP